MLIRTIFSGFGGQGVLSMGYTIANAAMLEGKYVTYLPSYGVEVRGGTANCTVVVSDEEIASPVASEPEFVVAMNHLHWPRKLNHAPLAIQSFSELIALQNAFPQEKQRDYFALAHVGLGDAYVQNADQGQAENLVAARTAWETGLARYPRSAELQQRRTLASKSPEEILRFVADLRSLKNPVNTDLNQIWVER